MLDTRRTSRVFLRHWLLAGFLFSMGYMYKTCLVMAGMLGLVSPAFVEPLQLKYGVNTPDLNADGIADLIVRTRWETMNAHAFDRYMVALTLPATATPDIHIYEVPLGTDAQRRIQTNAGAECLRTGYVFALNAEAMLEVTEYRLKPGETTYCEPTPLTTTTYRLTASGGDVGLPYFYLRQVKVSTSREQYTDVSAMVQ
jgi:hypothetical protein